MGRLHRVARAVAVLLLAPLTSGCRDLHRADPLYAAQADSSTAGYEIGGTHRGRADSIAHPGTPQAPRKGARGRGIAKAPPADTARSRGRSDAIAGTSLVRESAGSQAATRSSDSTSGSTSGDAATFPAELLEVPDDSIVVNTFLAYNPKAKTVWMDVIAGYDGSNGALNFNGGFQGAHTLVVPLGWRVAIRFANRDHELSHSAVVVRHLDAIPLMVPPAAFPNAYTISLEQGLDEGRTDEVLFSADTRGRYQLVCAVPGHGQGGMWVAMEVSETAVLPEYHRR